MRAGSQLDSGREYPVDPKLAAALIKDKAARPAKARPPEAPGEKPETVKPSKQGKDTKGRGE